VLEKEEKKKREKRRDILSFSFFLSNFLDLFFSKVHFDKRESNGKKTSKLKAGLKEGLVTLLTNVAERCSLRRYHQNS